MNHVIPPPVLFGAFRAGPRGCSLSAVGVGGQGVPRIDTLTLTRELPSPKRNVNWHRKPPEQDPDRGSQNVSFQAPQKRGRFHAPFRDLLAH
jgi:hypothetical protein